MSGNTRPSEDGPLIELPRSLATPMYGSPESVEIGTGWLSRPVQSYPQSEEGEPMSDTTKALIAIGIAVGLFVLVYLALNLMGSLI